MSSFHWVELIHGRCPRQLGRSEKDEQTVQFREVGTLWESEKLRCNKCRVIITAQVVNAHTCVHVYLCKLSSMVDNCQ